MWFAAFLALIVGLTLGLLGGGGSILTVPVLVYAVGLETKHAIATSLVVVGTTAAVSAVQHARLGNVRWKTGLLFGLTAMAGAGPGGWAADYLPGKALLLLFAAMMVATSVAMLRGRKEEPTPGEEAAAHGLGLVVLEGLVVGFVTGLVGAGGGFLVVPALVLLGGLPMREAVGTSLFVIALKSGAAFVGHASHVQLDWELTGTFTAATVVGGLLGGLVAPKVPAAQLRRAFAWFVLLAAGFVVGKEVGWGWGAAVSGAGAAVALLTAPKVSDGPASAARG